MTPLHSGAETDGHLTLPVRGPIQTIRPYARIAIVGLVMMLVGSLALVPSAAGAAQPNNSATTLRVDAANSELPVMLQSQVGHASLQPGSWLVDQLVNVLRTILERENTAAPVSSGNAIIDIIYAAADRYGQPREDMLRVARCESNLVPTAVNPSSNASGLFQFLPSTWATTPFADQNIFDPVANANAAAWMWDNGRRNEWVCQ